MVGVIIFIIIMALGIFIAMKIADFKERTKQHILKNTGISQSDQYGAMDKMIEKGYLEKFLQDYPEYTEESIKEVFKNFCTELFNRNPISQFSEKVCEKMQKDTKLDKLKNMQFRRIHIATYGKKFMIVNSVYTDGRDEYEITLESSIENNDIKLIRYSIRTGAVIGF